MDPETFKDFIIGERPVRPQTLPCICCEEQTTELDSVPSQYGDWDIDGNPATVCLGCDSEVRKWPIRRRGQELRKVFPY